MSAQKLEQHSLHGNTKIHIRKKTFSQCIQHAQVYRQKSPTDTVRPHLMNRQLSADRCQPVGIYPIWSTYLFWKLLFYSEFKKKY